MGEPNNLNEQMKVSIRDYFLALMEERDRLYDTRFKASETAMNAQFKASETAVNAALAAQEKAVAAAFLASEKAIVKAEDAQRDYNIRSNEFRGQLDDQAKTLMPRMEASTLFKSYEEKLDRLTDDIKSLRDFRMASSGAQIRGSEVNQTSQWLIGVAIVVVLALIQIILHFVPGAK
jgi:hypothetical protein